MIPCEEKPEITPLCPHCGAALTHVYCRGLTSQFGNRYIYFCFACLKTLGVSHRKGFWMG